MCITNSMRLKNRLETIKNHGMSKTKKYWHTEVGRNFRMTNIQAAIGCDQLKNYDLIFKRRESKYKELFKIFRSRKSDNSKPKIW